MLSALFALVVLSGIGAVYSKHQTRALFGELQRLQSLRDDLRVEWGRLQLEHSTWSAHGRVENIADQRLDMHRPYGKRVIIRP